MPLDPVIQSLFEQFPQLAIRPVWEKTPAEARVLFKQFCQFRPIPRSWRSEVEDVKMPGPAGPLGLRIYNPGSGGRRGVAGDFSTFTAGGFRGRRSGLLRRALPYACQ